MAQNWDFFGGINYGTYSMKDMKRLMRSINVPEIPLERVEDFPATVGIQGGATCLMPKVAIGFFFATSASDSRLRYADNSGSLIFDASCGTLLLGFDIQPILVKRKRWEMFLSFREGVSFNSATFKTELRLQGETTRSTDHLQSSNLFFAPGIGSRIFYRNFFVKPIVHYEAHIAKGSLKANGQDVTNDGEKLQIDWDGLRLGLCLGYRLNSQ